MNVNRLYVVQIYVCSAIDEKILDDDIFFGKVEQNFKGVFVKNAIVYNKNNSYIDLMSGETYKLGLDNVFEIG